MSEKRNSNSISVNQKPNTLDNPELLSEIIKNANELFSSIKHSKKNSEELDKQKLNEEKSESKSDI